LSGIGQRARDFAGRRRGEIKRRLTWLPRLAALAAGVAAGLLAPTVDATHPPDRLQVFFGVAAGALIAIVAAVAVVQLPQAAVRFFRPSTSIVLTAGFLAALAGLITTLDASIYRYLFAITVAAIVHGVVSTVLAGVANAAAQRDASRADRAAAIARLRDPGEPPD
jgi:hypothetical protein